MRITRTPSPNSTRHFVGMDGIFKIHQNKTKNQRGKKKQMNAKNFRIFKARKDHEACAERKASEKKKMNNRHFIIN